MSLTRLPGLWIAIGLATAGAASAQVMDDGNGLWTVALEGQAAPGRAMTESYNGYRIRLLPDGQVVELEKTGDVLTSKAPTTGISGAIGGNTANATTPQVRLTISGLSTPDKADDKLTGTWFGKKATFTRDLAVKAPIELNLAQGIGDRPWVRFMREVLIPKSAEDRESYHRFDRQQSGGWIMGTELGAKGYWITKGWMRDQTTFDGVFQSYHGTMNSPRSILGGRFNPIISGAMRPDKKSELALALSSLGMYFSTGSGGAVRLIITTNRDSIVYYITDRRAHDKTGLVVNATPTHRPLASSFGKWQNDAGMMVLADDEPYDRAVLELMVKANTSSMNQVSKTGRSAFTDYMGIMAIEDQRGVMFGNDDLDWGRNMTEASFDISIIRSLGHGETRQRPVYRASPERTITDEPLTMKSSVAGQLDPSRSVAPKTMRITATGLPAVVDDGEGTLYAEGTSPANDSLGSIDYSDGSYSITWKGFSREARVTYKDSAQKAQTRTLRLTADVSGTLGAGKLKPGSVRIKAPGLPDLEDDSDGSLYDVGADHATADSRGYLDYDDGSLNFSLDGVPTAAITATYKTTTDAQAHTQTLPATVESSGLVDPLSVVPGSVRLTSGNGPALVDDGKGSLHLENDATSRGRVDYASGTYNARWTGIPSQPIALTFRYGNNQTKTVPIAAASLTVESDVTLTKKKVTPRSVHIKAAGQTEVVDDGKGTLYDVGTDPTKSERGSVDYAEGTVNVTWKSPPTGKATITYKTKAGEVTLTAERELAMQVIVDGDEGPELRPGTPSYIDTLNGADDALEGGHKGGDDCQVGELSTLEELTTQWLRAEHADAIDRLEAALTPFGYTANDENLFSAMTVTFYDAEKFGKVTPAQGNAIVEAGMNLFKTIRRDSRKLEAFILAHGVKKSDRWAPRASGF